jgi:2,4-diketo-3-deoxy-L-fuconate hydrolase
MTLHPGEVSTGRPDGVGFTRTPPRFLGPGDVTEVELDRGSTVVEPTAPQAVE